MCSISNITFHKSISFSLFVKLSKTDHIEFLWHVSSVSQLILGSVSAVETIQGQSSFLQWKIAYNSLQWNNKVNAPWFSSDNVNTAIRNKKVLLSPALDAKSDCIVHLHYICKNLAHYNHAGYPGPECLHISLQQNF